MCILQQATSAMVTAGVDEHTKIEVLRKVSTIVGEISPMISPSEISSETNRIIREETGIDDLYAQIKIESTRLALEIYPDLIDLILYLVKTKPVLQTVFLKDIIHLINIRREVFFFSI